MKLVIEVKDSKAEFLLELLRSLPFVKSSTISNEKDEVLDSVRKAVEEMKLVKAGQLKPDPMNLCCVQIFRNCWRTLPKNPAKEQLWAKAALRCACA